MPPCHLPGPHGVTSRATHLVVRRRVGEGILVGFHGVVVVFLCHVMLPGLDADGGCQLLLEGEHFRLLQGNPLQYPGLEVQGLGEPVRLGSETPSSGARPQDFPVCSIGGNVRKSTLRKSGPLCQHAEGRPALPAHPPHPFSPTPCPGGTEAEGKLVFTCLPCLHHTWGCVSDLL